jgi:hypothetical protein
MSSIGKLSKPWLGLGLGLACACTFVASGAVSAAQRPWDWVFAVHNGLTRERVVGLLDVPQLVSDAGVPEKPAVIKLYGTPSAAKPPLGVMEVEAGEPKASCRDRSVVFRRANERGGECMPMEESGYENPAVIVYERTGQWFRIALQRGSAWMMSSSPKHFHPYPELLKDRLSMMTEGWDGRLWSTPGAPSARAAVPKVKALLDGLEKSRREGGDAGNVDVEVLAIQRVGGEAWIQVRITDGHCGDKDEPGTLDTGWIPAHRATGKPSVWFYSRGC